MSILQISRMEMTMKTITVSFMLIIIVTAANEISGENISEILEHTMPAYTVAKHSHILLVSNECRRHLEIFKAGVDKRVLWSLRMLDASGEPTPGFIYGNNFWTGVKNQCYDLNNHVPVALHPDNIKNVSLYRNPEEENPPYTVNFFSAHFVHNSTVQYQSQVPSEEVITLGLCLPDICKKDELGVILKKIFHERILTVTSLYGADFSLFKVRNLKGENIPELNWRMLIVIIVILVTLMLMAVGTCYDLCIHQKRLEKTNNLNAVVNISNYSKSNGSSVTGDIQKKDKFSENDNDDVISAQKVANVETGCTQESTLSISKPSIPGRIVLCFSVYSNSKDIFNLSDSKGIRCLEGLRFLSMVYTLMVHTVLFGQWYTDNKRWAYRLGEEFINQIVSNGSLTVDTYFFISSFLLAYIFFRIQRRKNSIVPKGFHLGLLIVAFVKRIIRLTPPYMMTVGVVELMTTYRKHTTVFYVNDRVYDGCVDYWWRNLLYINNFFPRNEMCLAWSWYLSNEMQFFLIGMILLMFATKYLYTVMGIVVIMLGTHTVIAGYVAWDVNYIPTYDVWWILMDVIYDRPWMRIGPSLIGLATGYLLAVHKEKLKFNKITLWICWIVGATCNLFALFGLYDKTIYYSTIPAVVHTATWRTLWAIGIAWIVIACTTNNGGYINKVLSFKGWIPGSKLTYCAYLINPLIITPVYLTSELAFHVDFLPNEIMFLGFCIATYFFSYIWSLMFEIPYMLLVKLWDDMQKKK